MKNFSELDRTEFLHIIETLPYGILLFDSAGTIISANTLIQNAVPIDMALSDLNDVFLFFHLALEGDIEKQKMMSTEFIIPSIIQEKKEIIWHSVPLGEKYFDIQIVPIQKENEGVLILTDVTRLKELNDFKTEFLSMTFHQLKTPLAGVNWTLDMFLKGEVGTISTEQAEYLHELKIRNKRMMKLVNQLLNMSHIESAPFVSKPEVLNITNLLNEMFDDLKTLVKEKQIEIQYNPSIETPYVFLDKNLVYQVIHNLITNAIRYSSHKKGSVVSITGTMQEDDYILTIQDSGIGIPVDAQKNIFKKFFRADNAQKRETDGSGFGLYIVKKIVEFCNGRLWFESEEGKGTIFSVSFPLYKGK